MKLLQFASAVFAVVAEAIALTTAGFEGQIPFILFTFLGSVFVSQILIWVSHRLANWRFLPTLIVLTILGAGLSIPWCFLIGVFVSYWILGIGPPVLLCWMAGGAAGGCTVAALKHRTLTRAVPWIAAVSVSASFAVFLILVIARIDSNDQRLTSIEVQLKFLHLIFYICQEIAGLLGSISPQSVLSSVTSIIAPLGC